MTPSSVAAVSSVSVQRENQRHSFLVGGVLLEKRGVVLVRLPLLADDRVVAGCLLQGSRPRS